VQARIHNRRLFREAAKAAGAIVPQRTTAVSRLAAGVAPVCRESQKQRLQEEQSGMDKNSRVVMNDI